MGSGKTNPVEWGRDNVRTGNPAISLMDKILFAAIAFDPTASTNAQTTAAQVGSIVVNTVTGYVYRKQLDKTWILLADSSNSIPTGFGMDYFGSSAPTGWVFAGNGTIGNAASFATIRANTDTFNLFKLLWESLDTSVRVLWNSAGSLVVAGASALADWNGNKRLFIPDKRGRVSVGKDDMLGAVAGRMVSGTFAPDGTKLGQFGGEQNHTLLLAELASHNHTMGNQSDDGLHDTSMNRVVGIGATVAGYGVGDTNTGRSSGFLKSNVHTHAINSSGSDTSHNNVQPSLITNYAIKL